jgi:hypothetical protein
MTPKLDGFRALGVKHPKDFLTQVQKVTNSSPKGYEAKLSHIINQSKFLTF